MDRWIILNPLAATVLVSASLLYLRAVRILAKRNRPVSLVQRSCFFLGIALIAIALMTRIDTVGEHSLLSVHMLQHLLLADISGPLLLLGMRAPMLYFFWPKPILVSVARMKPLRRAWSFLVRPVPALTFWLITLFAWHVPAAYIAAMHNPVLHIAEHVTFAFGGMLAWWPLLDPTHHRTQARLWKAFYVIVARVLGGILGVILTSVPVQIYGDYYGSRSLAYGLSPLTDQRVAGSLMMSVDTVIVFVGFFYFLLASAPKEDYSAQSNNDPVTTVS